MIKNVKKTFCSKHFVSLFCVLFLVFSSITMSSCDDNGVGGGGTQVMVSLGDSYSAGEGIEHFYGYNEELSKRVENPDWLAHRSENSWPGMLTLPGVDGTMKKNRNKYWYFAAASGATTDNIAPSVNSEDNDGKQKKEYCKDKYSDVAYLDPQVKVFEELEKKGQKADYVTLTLGGNDVDFVGVIISVVLGSTYLNFGGLKDSLQKKKENFDKETAPKLEKAYNAINKYAGKQAKIIVAGYPNLLSSNIKSPFISFDEAIRVNKAVHEFNEKTEKLINNMYSSDMKIYFVSVEKKFSFHEAYSIDPYINEIILPAQSEDLVDPMKALEKKKNGERFFKDAAVSAYSIHPNIKGAKAYAACVQDKINSLENQKNNEEMTTSTTNDTNKPVNVSSTSTERDVVLVLDTSSSMNGTPLDETKKASIKFIESTIGDGANIGVVNYDDESTIASHFSNDKNSLENIINGLGTGGSTNIEAGLRSAEGMLAQSQADKKIIVLMSDGEPNSGLVDDDLISYADELKQKGIYIYTLGFFESLDEKTDAQILMEKIASEGCHYEVSDADSLVFFFEDIADQINGQKYIYVRIACPVDVSVVHNGETLNSSDDNLITRTSFGSLTFEDLDSQNFDAENSDDLFNQESKNQVKILRLKEGVDYDIDINGTGSGKMNYSIGFMSEDGVYSDFRKFNNIKITPKTEIYTVAKVSDKTMLNVDEDGDGSYDLVYEADKNGLGKIVDNSFIICLIIILSSVLLLLIMILIIYKKVKRKQRIKYLKSKNRR